MTPFPRWLSLKLLEIVPPTTSWANSHRMVQLTTWLHALRGGGGPRVLQCYTKCQPKLAGNYMENNSTREMRTRRTANRTHITSEPLQMNLYYSNLYICCI